MNTVDPSVKLISIDDNRKKAWMFSRPGFDHSDLDMEKIGSMDMSLNSTCMLTFEITSSVLFRDWLFSIRPIFPWARSSRSAPLTKENCLISSECCTHDSLINIKKVLKNIKKGVPQDIAREGLPLSMSTAFTVTMDFRSVCGMIKTMEKISTEMHDSYGRLFINEMENVSGFNTNKIKSFENSYMIKENEKINGKFYTGEIIHGNFRVKLALMSQFLRQSHSIVKTNLWNFIRYSGYSSTSTLVQSNKIDMVFYAQKSSYINLMKLRSHWFADWSRDMWGEIVGDFIKNMEPHEFWDFIPNGNGKPDPYHRDMISRVTGEEHNLPCPIMLEYPELVFQRLEIFGENPIILKYIDLVENGFIKNNPNNKYRKQYLEMKNGN